MDNQNNIDENLYSRQLYVLGHDAMQKMNNTSILISGINGLGAEIAKNVILGGIKNIVLHDTNNCTFDDLSSNFYLNESLLGQNRIEASINMFKQLNSNVNVSAYTGVLNEEYIKQFSVVILVNHKLEESIRINNITHKYGIKFITTSSHGLMFQIFNDFCDHQIKDTDGEQIKTGLIANISKEENCIITCHEQHHLTNDTIIKINGPSGMNEICDKEYVIKYIDQKSFGIKEDTTNFTDYISGGSFVQVKETVNTKFKSLTESLKEPDFLMINFLNFDRHLNLHACWKALHDSNDDGDNKDNIKELAKKYYNDLNEDDADKFIHCVGTNLSPIDSICGGMVAQEIIKACSNKYTPIYQWLYYDAFECLPPNYKELDVDIESESRYDGQIKVFGNEFQKKLAEEKYFVVGSGAIGCELLKNMAQIGLGNIIVTDMDTIEKSNLSRQFLFRNSDIGKLKSQVASDAIKLMNPSINIIFHANKVCPETNNIYNKDFFDNLTGVANALDNIEARKYVDGLCLENCKPLLESGTLGTKGNTQVVVPYLTETYSSSADPPEQGIPACTLKNFPYKNDHTIQWARDVFEGEFFNSSNYANQYIKDQDFINKLEPGQKTEIIESIIDILCNKPKDYIDCVTKAFGKWHTYYRDNIHTLLNQFPSDSKTNEGTLFWSGTKRMPVIAEFDVKNDMHVKYVYYMANLYAHIYELDKCDEEFAIKCILNLKPPSLPIIESGVKDHSNQHDELNILLNKLPPITSTTVKSIEFEKDNDDNYHIDFVTVAANMRNINYGIDMTSRYETKGIAGKIIPAIATTTSIVAGLSVLELYKLVWGCRDIEKFKNNFLNLALPFIGNADPIKCGVTKIGNNEYTMWDKFVIDPVKIFGRNDVTMEELIDYMNTTHNFTIEMLTIGTFSMYNTFGDKNKLKERMGKTIKQIYREHFNKQPDGCIYIDVCIELDDDMEEDLIVPSIRYLL